MNTASYISVVEPVGAAIDWTKRVLFQPFDIAKWFVIGFCAWLAFLGQGGGGGGGGNYSFGGGNRRGAEGLEQAKAFVVENLAWLLPLVIMVLLFAIAIGVLFTWLQSRGQFMFLDCVVRNKAVIAEPWRMYAPQANSLFLFQLVLGFGTLVLILPLLVALVGAILWMVSKQQVLPGWMLVAVASGLAVFVVGVVSFLIGKLTRDFVVPIMYIRQCRCLEGWRLFNQLLTGNVGHLVLYLLFQIVLGLAMAALVVAVVLVTCCVAGCLLMIPYLGTVLALPLLVFSRSYSAIYLSQYGPDWNIFQAAGWESTPATAQPAPP